MSDRIHWEEDTGLKLWCGSVGTIGSMFTIAVSLIEGEPHLLMSSFPGQERKRRDSVDLNELKAEAERWLSEFASSLGAVFPDEPGEVRETLRSLRCVQAGWAFGVPDDGREQWLDLVAAAVAAPSAPVTSAPKEED